MLNPRIILAIVAFLSVAGCATAPDARKADKAAIEADIKEILSLTQDGEPARCISEHDFRGYQALSDEYLLFRGRGDKQWINELHGRCHDLRYGQVLLTKSVSSSKLCEHDRFAVADWFAWPWYRRWPWDWGSWGTGQTCFLGKFHPVNEQQVQEIKSLLDR